MLKDILRNRNNLIVFTIYILFSIQNGFFDELYRVGNMDAISLLLSVILIIYFTYCIYTNTIKINYLFLYLCILVLYKLILGVIIGISVSEILIDSRTTIYLICSYFIFKSVKFQEINIIYMIKIGGFLNSILFLFFMIKLFNEIGIGARDVTFNLYISMLSLATILFIDKKGIFKITNITIVIINILSIIISQQRTLIIPLSIILIIFLIKNIKINIKNIIYIVLIVLLITILVNYIKKIGIWELVINRFSKQNFSGESSTLNVRIEAMKEAFKNHSFIIYIFGCGFGQRYSELEMLIPNYIIKYGIISSSIIIWGFADGIIRIYRRFGSFQRKFLNIYFIMLIGGIISGFGGASGQMLTGIILGICSNKSLIKYL